MCISATKRYRKTALIYLFISLFFGIFGAIYEYFSFGVYSPFMVFAFAFPLLGGTLPALVISLLPMKSAPGTSAAWLYRCGIATLTIGSVIRGVLDIYGTTNQLTQWYWHAGIAFIAAGILTGMIHYIMVRINCNKSIDET